MATASDLPRSYEPAAPDGSVAAEQIRVRGLVQGVGFRPLVWRLARDCGLHGDVYNDAEGVLIRVWGKPAARRRLLSRLASEAPPLARIESVECTPLVGRAPAADFRIAASAGGVINTGVAADAATCPACLSEVFHAADRRHRYPFTNCTHCGPRLSIVERMPYDRVHTSMAAFTQCAACQAEYEDPADRRFHAQPNACPDCGPKLWLETIVGEHRRGANADPIKETQRLLQAGHIVAIKGLGGIHLACDATNPAAVARLRSRKHRYAKPFALMARDEAMVHRYCTVRAGESLLLQDTAAPIVLLEAGDPATLPAAVAPQQRCYGFMLPYTPLHHLLMAGLDGPIVLTSGNRADEPQCVTNDEAHTRLEGIADVLLLHDRAIVNRLDDSVARVVAGAPALIRRARGYAPAPLGLPTGFGEAPMILGLGGELKNTFCLLKNGEAILSQHLGDLENAATHAAYRQTLELYQALFEHRPEAVAIDRHPEYLPSKLGREHAEEAGLPLLEIQHHHAHIAACLADNELGLDESPVLGIALDGTGYGDDGTIWGGEFLLAGYRGYRRLAALETVPMPGGTQAIHQPWRMAYAYLSQVLDWDRLAHEYAELPFFQTVAHQPLTTLAGMLGSGFNCPLTTSCGRLFDAVAAATGLCYEIGYEGHAAIALEAAIDKAALQEGQGYPFALAHDGALSRLEPRPMWQALLDDLQAGVSVGVIAARFHTGLATGIAAMVERLTNAHDNAWGGRVALSGGVFQNAVLCEVLIPRLEGQGLQVLRHTRVPANDGGLSLGQAAIAAAQTMHGFKESLNDQ